MTRATRAQHDFDCQQGVDIENLRIPGAHVRNPYYVETAEFLALRGLPA